MNGRELLMEEKKIPRSRAHSVILENRERASFTGVTDVESFNEEEVVMVTEMGVIVLSGEGLHISRLNLDDGQLMAEGHIAAVEYIENAPVQKRGGLFGRVFK